MLEHVLDLKKWKKSNNRFLSMLEHVWDLKKSRNIEKSIFGKFRGNFEKSSLSMLEHFWDLNKSKKIETSIMMVIIRRDIRPQAQGR